MPSKFYNLDTDDTLSANSDYLISSQKAIKTNLDKKADKSTTYTKDEVNNLISSSGQGLPSQSGQQGKFLSTDGISAKWESLPENLITSDELEESLKDKLTVSNIKAGNNITIDVVDNDVYINSTASGGEPSGGGNVDLSNYYTKYQSDAKFASKSSEHTHANKQSILDLFTLNNNVLSWNSIPIPLNPTTIEQTNSGVFSDKEIFNSATICTEYNIKAITDQLVYITNNSVSSVDENGEEQNYANLFVYNGSYKLDSIIIPPLATQGYRLPLTTGIRINGSGNISAQFIITGYIY